MRASSTGGEYSVVLALEPGQKKEALEDELKFLEEVRGAAEGLEVAEDPPVERGSDLFCVTERSWGLGEGSDVSSN